MKNVFLTGAPHGGKSTALDRALDLLAPRQIGGFRTIKMPTEIPGAIGEVHIIPAFGSPGLHTGHLVGIRWGNGRFTALPGAFEREGCALLTSIPPGTDVIIMDELGIMEQDAPCFCAAVLAALDGHISVLGVIKPQSSPFLDEVRSHRKSTVIELTAENRDSLPERIAGIMQTADTFRQKPTGF